MTVIDGKPGQSLYITMQKYDALQLQELQRQYNAYMSQQMDSLSLVPKAPLFYVAPPCRWWLFQAFPECQQWWLTVRCQGAG